MMEEDAKPSCAVLVEGIYDALGEGGQLWRQACWDNTSDLAAIGIQVWVRVDSLAAPLPYMMLASRSIFRIRACKARTRCESVKSVKAVGLVLCRKLPWKTAASTYD